MIMSKSESLQFVGAKSTVALVLEDEKEQCHIMKESGIEPLIRLLKSDKSSKRVLLASMETVAALCITKAHESNAIVQAELIDKGALRILLDMVQHNYSLDSLVKIEAAHALACLLLNRPSLDESSGRVINIQSILDMLNTEDIVIRMCNINYYYYCIFNYYFNWFKNQGASTKSRTCSSRACLQQQHATI
jgi:hypothetical protein